MKRVLLHAYTHFNLGDDLFIKIICERYPNAQFTLDAPQAYKEKFREIKNLLIFPNDSFPVRGIRFICKQLNKLPLFYRLLSKNHDVIVQIGGSLFIQNKDWAANLAHTKALQVKGIPTFLLGINFGPFHDDDFYFKHQQAFQAYTDICFREQYSYRLFQTIPHARLAGDIGFLLSKQKASKKQKSVIISVIKPSIREDLSHYDEVYYDKIKEITIFLIHQGYEVILMSFCAYEGDPEAIQAILSLLPEQYQSLTKAYYYEGDLEAGLQHIAEAQFMIATRFHAFILALTFEIPVFPIIYSQKTRHVIEDIHFDKPFITFDQLHRLDLAEITTAMQIGRAHV